MKVETYEILFNPDTTGVYRISLVKNPAIESQFIALSKDQELIQLKIVNEEKRILMGAVLVPDKIIPRNQGGRQFNIVFPAETIRLTCHNFSRQGYNNNANIEHNPELVLTGVTFVENWIKEDAVHDKSVAYGLDEPVGTWITMMKIDNNELWEDYIKTGKVAGFSVESFFELSKLQLTNINTNDMIDYENLLKAVKDGFADLGKKITGNLSLAKVTTEDGSVDIHFEGEALAKDTQVWMEGPEKEKLEVPDGEYKLADGVVLVVAGSLVIEKKDAASDEEAAKLAAEAAAAPVPGATIGAVKSEEQITKVFYALSKAMGEQIVKTADDLRKEFDGKLLAKDQEILELTKKTGEIVPQDWEKMTNLERRRLSKTN